MTRLKMKTQFAELLLAERAVPRYTSYPTAPHFNQTVNAAVARHWLTELPAASSLSLYLHVPFCSAICSYCGCHTKAVHRREPLDHYAATLAREVELWAEATPAHKVWHLHWGGGTPSLLGPANLCRIAKRLRDCFDLDDLDEYAIELDPRSVDRELVEALASMGVSRASLGVQDVNAHVQEAIGRIQPETVVERAVQLLREVGIAAINLDLMYGLPHQTIDDVRRTCEFAISLSPARLAAFGYAHVPWMKTHQRLIDAATLPGAAARLAHIEAARSFIEGAGYVTIGLDHFARPDDALAIVAANGTLRRNFQGYTIDKADALLPIGGSSVGKLPQGYLQNASDVAGWRRAIDAGQFAVTRGAGLSADDRLRAAVIERLMCNFTVDYASMSKALAGDEVALDSAAAELDALARQGILTHSKRIVCMTPEGRPLVRLAAAAFDVYLCRGAARHSIAV